MVRRTAVVLTLALEVLASACAIPTTQLGTVSPDDIRSEQLKQQELAIESDLRQQQRVEDVGHTLLVAATPFCNGMVVPRAGIRFANAYAFAPDYRLAAQMLGFSDTLIVTGVASGSAAERAGFVAGDRVIALNGSQAPIGPNATQTLAGALGVRSVPAPNVTVRRGRVPYESDSVASTTLATTGPSDRTISMPADTICNYNLAMVRKDDLNAWSDGVNVIVTSAMLRFAADDDELAAVLSHEIAHNAMRHIQAKQRNAGLGGLFGALVDIAAATQGVNTQGQFTKQGMEAGAMVFSQDFEREADYVGVYLLARAGRSTTKAPNFWRRMAQEDPHSIKFASTHPTSAERFVRLEQASREIEQKLARGEDLRPEMRGASGSHPGPTTRALASAPRPSSPASAPQPNATVTAPSPAMEKPVAAMPRQAAAVSRPAIESAGTLADPADVPVGSYTTLSKVVKGDSASYTFGPAAPRSGLSASQARRRAARAYQDGNEALEVRLYDQAEAKFREATLYDGGESKYHAALGELLLRRGKLAGAEAALTAAVLLDMENAHYHQLLTEARKRR